MLTRLTHAGFAFAAVVAAYQAYVLLLVPIVEPPNASAAPLQAFTAEDFARTPQALERYRGLLQAYFPADHWCFQAPPIILENDQTIVVCASNYERDESGELRVPHCAVIYFPTVRDRAGAPPRDAIIMEPAGGAMLQLDSQADGAFGSLGRMQFGQLLGEVHVRSDMKEPGPADDLAIHTRDLYMNEDLLRTPEAVQFQLGSNHAHGRGLEIRLVKTAPADGKDAPAGQLDALEITSEVAALIVPGRTTLLGDVPPSAANGAPAPPAEINCTGSFTVDFDAKVATFNENVVVRQRHADGKLDVLRAPHELTIYFAEMQEWGGDAPAASGLAFGSGRLQPATINAGGYPGEPVVLEAASQGASARGERLIIELLSRKVSLNGEEEVSLTYQGAEVHAPMVQYELPPRDSPQRLGQLWAPGGTGWLKATPDPTRPGDVVEVRWTKAMSMVRRNGQPVLTLDGRPRVEMTGMGVLWADQLELHLREPKDAAPAAPTNATAGPLPSSIEVEQIVATGNVGIDSAQVKCDVSRLELAVDYPTPTAPVNPAAPGRAATAPSSLSPTASQPVRPSTPAAQSPLLGLNRAGAPARRYKITGRVLTLRAVMHDRTPQVTSIAVEGGVVFQESPLAVTAEEPLRILAERLEVADADALDAKIKITGSPASGTLPGGLADIVAQGARLRAPEIIVHRGTSQAWINSPGAVSLQMTRDALGQPLAAPQDVLITWRESMKLEGDRITFLGDVKVKHTDGTLDTRRLVAVLTAPVQFDGGASSRPPELAQVECSDGIEAEFVQRDELGNVTSQQKLRDLQSLVVNQITGAIRGDGPGHIDSVHLAKGDGSWLVLPENVGPNLEHAAPVEQDASDKPPQLKHLSVDFVRGVDGNIHKPEVRVYGDVKTVYGPINSWDERLEMTPGGSPEPDVFWITCDSLKVSDSPLARLQTPTGDKRRRAFGQVELQAEVDVVIEGVHPEHGAFTLQGNRVSFDQAKAIFMAEGNDAELASITFQQYPGGPQLPQTAQKIMFFLNTKDVKFQGFKQIQWQGFFNK